MPDDKEAPVYTAEKILHKRIRRGKVEYFIKWKGWAAKWNTWEPEKHILDKLLIEDFNNRNRKRQKSRSLVRNSVNKPQKPIKNRSNNKFRTRRLRSSSSSSSSSDISASAIVSPITNDEDSIEKKKSDNNQSNHIEKIELNQKDLSNLSKESDQDEDEDVEEEEEDKSNIIVKSEIDESIEEYLWKPTKTSSTITTITEVTDQGVTVLIRELNDNSTSNISRTPRFLGYGNGGRGGRH